MFFHKIGDLLWLLFWAGTTIYEKYGKSHF